ncbi:protein required for cell viability [Stemphylium lycopersici]|uniref:Protein required for cell viability n=1 Tax=Stemphylium lycopersici TaxID=183478 RepID=A0A364MZT3_STELY|nr:hypothetical protein TW65_07974 [Stemphylium lycopersici]RAQ99099.1 protein required for cell viability [Stemphylium lycopersici]RAR08043.1 protein required for cell viability [Stemphylium lycopersici]
MGAVEDAVDAAANFIGPFVDKERKYSGDVPTDSLVDQAVSHLQAINAADLAADPNAPYDASLAGVVYGLLDLIVSLAMIPRLSSGVAFSQRPRSVLTAIIFTPPNHDMESLGAVTSALLPILQQKGSGVQPLVSQRILPDILSSLVELCFSPSSPEATRSTFLVAYQTIMNDTPTSRLLPVLTTFLQQPLPSWLKPVISKELSLVPLRTQGVRHTIEFLALSYLSKNSHVPEGTSGPQSQIPIPLEAITQATKLLVLPPSGITQEDWFKKLAPQLLHLLDGHEGKELCRAAGQIIAGGILSKKTTGAPGTVGWDIFASSSLLAINPRATRTAESQDSGKDTVVVPENDLKLALRRLKTISTSYSHAGLIKRLISPLLLPLWALLNYAKIRPSLDKEWSALSTSLLSRYMEVASDAKQIDNLSQNLFWDGDATWTFSPGSEGGVEIRRRPTQTASQSEKIGTMEGILGQISDLDNRVNLLVSLMAEAGVPDDVAASVFLGATKRWLAPDRKTKTDKDKAEAKSLLLAGDEDTMEDPLAALVDAKFSEALARRFQEQFANSPQHILELMAQLIDTFVAEHKASVQRATSKGPTSKRAMLDTIVQKKGVSAAKGEEEAANEDLVAFALSIVNTVVSSAGFKKTASVVETLHKLPPSLAYLSQSPSQAETQSRIPTLVSNAATALLHLIAPAPSSPSDTRAATTDPLADHRTKLQTCLVELQSPDPPNRTWALNTVHAMLKSRVAFPVFDVPSLTHMLLSSSLADPESYVHLAAIPVLVTLATRAPKPAVGILVDAFVDVDERALKLARGKQTEEKERELRDALDFRLRVGEVLSKFVGGDEFWLAHDSDGLRYACVKQVTEACLSLASRRGQRTQTLSARNQVADSERVLREEGEAAWGGPIPNILEPDGADPQEQADYVALQKIVQGWEDTGIEEDVRVRASGLSVLSTVFEHRLHVLRQPAIDAALQMVLLILTVERGDEKALLRRAAVLVVMGLLRGIDAATEAGQERMIALTLTQQMELERVVKWVKDEDADELVRDHAASVMEGLETLRMKELYRVREEGLKLGPDLGLEGNLRGLKRSTETSLPLYSVSPHFNRTTMSLSTLLWKLVGKSNLRSIARLSASSAKLPLHPRATSLPAAHRIAGSLPSPTIYRTIAPLTVPCLALPPATRSLVAPPLLAQHAPVAMLAIWSRATSNPGTCRCISCVPNTAALARARSRAPLRGPWAFGTPTSTLVYTTVFAAALTIDARAKALRNRQWERAFAHLSEPKHQPPPVSGAGGARVATDPAYEPPPPHGLILDEPPQDLDWNAMQNIIGMELVEDDVLDTQEVQSQIRDYSELAWDDLRFDSRFPGAPLLEWPANTGPDLVRFNLPPQSLWAPDVLRLNAVRRRHTWKKLAVQELSTGLLIQELLHKAGLPRFLQTAEKELDKLAPQIRQVASMDEDRRREARLEILEKLENLRKIRVDTSPQEIIESEIRANHPAIPSYYQDADGDFYSITKQMNDGIRTVLRETPRGNDRTAALAVAKICHNLLISSASPDLQTFNTLLVGFRRWKRAPLVDSVIPAFYANKIRPNEITCREILGYYVSWGNSGAESFSRFVAIMRGFGDALMLARPDLTINEASQDRLVRLNPEKVLQKVFPTPMVFSALINGVMKFAGFDRALDIYYEMKADGWGLDVKGLTRLLGDCVRRADWEGGLYVWEEINSIKARVRHHDMSKAYSHMLSLCSLTGNTVAFNQILNDLAKGDFDRKMILDAATTTARIAQGRHRPVAPAWVADNVMIAVSDFVQDSKPSAPRTTPNLMDTDEALVLQHDTESFRDIEHNTADTKETWASWVEYEFGERPKDPEP